MQDAILISNHHGEFQTTPMRFDLALAEYLPASVNELRVKVEKLFHTTKYRDLGTVTELIMVLASFDQPSSRPSYNEMAFPLDDPANPANY